LLEEDGQSAWLKFTEALLALRKETVKLYWVDKPVSTMNGFARWAGPQAACLWRISTTAVLGRSTRV